MLRLLLAAVTAPALLLASPASAAPAVDPGTGTTYDSAPVTVPMTFPVVGPVSYADTWLACRSGCARMHMGQDLMGRKLQPLVAAFDGVVTSLTRESTPNSPGGNSLVLTSDRGRTAGWSAVYVHVNNDSPGTDDGRGTAGWSFPAGLERGSRVVAGQLVGWVGDSGNAEDVGPQLHVELRQGPGWSGTARNAFPSLRAARRLPAPLPSGPHPDGTLVRHPSGALFLLEGGRKRPVSAGVLAATGRTAASAVPVTAAESLGYPTAAPLPPRDGSVLRDPAGTTWLVTGGARVEAGPAALAALGRRTPRVVDVAAADLAGLAVRRDLPGRLYPGALVRAEGRPDVLLVDRDGRLRPVLHPAVLASHGLTSADVAVLPAGALDGTRLGDPLPLRDGTLVQTPSHRVAVVSGGAARRLWDSRQVAAYGYTGRPRLLVPDALLDGLATAALTAR